MNKIFISFCSLVVLFFSMEATPTEAMPSTLVKNAKFQDKYGVISVSNSKPNSNKTNRNKPPVYEYFITRLNKYGRYLGKKLLTETNKKFRLNDTFYDAHRVFLEIEQHTGQTEPWRTYANKARDIYKNEYLVPNNYKVAGWMRFPHGPYLDWKRNGNSASKSVLLTLNEAGQTSTPEKTSAVYVDTWYEQAFSRPIAYSLMNNMLAEKAGATRNTERVTLLVNMALGHIEQWTTGVYLDGPGWRFAQAFMTGLTSSALIEYYDRSVELGNPDSRVPVALKKMADWLWANMWVADVGGTSGNWNDNGGTGYGAFRYVVPAVDGVGSTAPAPMVSQLIVASYAWLYKHTCDATYKAKADLIFSGGVMLVKGLSKGKFYNQQHREVFNYFRWRDKGDQSCR